MKQTRWKSKVLWTSIIAQAVTILQLLGVFTRLGFDAGSAGNVGAAVLQLLVIIGVLNDPTSINKF